MNFGIYLVWMILDSAQGGYTNKAREKMELQEVLDAHQPRAIDVESKENKSLILTCNSSRPWFLCVWEGPKGLRLCSLKYRTELCDSNDRIHLSGNSSSCSMNISSVELADHGSWNCVLSEEESYLAVRQSFQLQVHRSAPLHLIPEQKVVVVEGERAELVCRSSHVFPAPTLSWETDKELWGQLEIRTVVSRSDSHLMLLESQALYTADLRDSGAVFSCSSTQTSTNSTIIHTDSKFLILQVLPARPVQSLLFKQSGYISLGFVIMISVLVFIIVIILLVFRSKKSCFQPKSSYTTTLNNVDLLQGVGGSKSKSISSPVQLIQTKDNGGFPTGELTLFLDSSSRESGISSEGCVSRTKLGSDIKPEPGSTSLASQEERNSAGRTSQLLETHFPVESLLLCPNCIQRSNYGYQTLQLEHKDCARFSRTDMDRSTIAGEQNEYTNTSFTLPRLPYCRSGPYSLDHCGSYNNVLRECNESDQNNTYSLEKRTQTPDFKDEYAQHASLSFQDQCAQLNSSREHCSAHQLMPSSEYPVHCAQISPCNQLFYCDQACFPAK